MTTFLRDFLHKDRDQAEELDIVIINKYVIIRRDINKMNYPFFFLSKKNSRNRNGSIIKTILYESTIFCWQCNEYC